MVERHDINSCIEVDCLIVKKVYDACSKRDCLERALFCVDFPCGDADDFKFIRAEFGKAEVEHWDGYPFFKELNENYALMRFVAAVPVFVIVKRKCNGEEYRLPARLCINGHCQCDNKIRFPVEVVVYAPAEFLRQGRFEPYVESYAEAGYANIIDNQNLMQLSIGVFLIVKVISEVQLKIPTYGFCDIPPECEDQANIDFCDGFMDEEITPFPDFFPPQQRC